jgi:hypothetical protein
LEATTDTVEGLLGNLGLFADTAQTAPDNGFGLSSICSEARIIEAHLCDEPFENA